MAAEGEYPVYFMPDAITRYLKSPITVGLTYFVGETLLSFLSVFGPLLFYVEATVHAAGLPNPVSWFTLDTAVTLTLALYVSVLVFYVCVSRPGITASPILAFSQWMVEIACERQLTKRTKSPMIWRPYILYFVKFVLLVAGQLLGAYLAAFSFYTHLNATQRTNFAALRQSIDNASDGSNLTTSRSILLSALFMYFYAWSFDSLYRVSPQGRQTTFAKTPMYSFIGSAALVAMARFIGVLILFPIVGSPLNFLVLLSLNIYFPTDMNYWSAALFFAGEAAGALVSLFFAMIYVYNREFFDPRKKRTFGYERPSTEAVAEPQSPTEVIKE